jgi:antitoxin (DNA-binding transcriptional repressor) of toxin-antitoxin stability system
MNATLTELRRKTGTILSAVIHRNKTVHLTEHGALVADLTPRTRPISGEEFAKLWRDRLPLDKATAQEVLNNIRETRQADALPTNAICDFQLCCRVFPLSGSSVPVPRGAKRFAHAGFI